MSTPANPTVRAGSADKKRIPMSVPVQKLSIPEIPGYHTHWFLGTAGRLDRALQGGYEFVDEREVVQTDTGLGGTSTRTGNTDLGSRVTRVAGTSLGTDGQPVRLVLMKIKKELYEEDQKLVEAGNTKVINSLLGGRQAGDVGGDASHRYVDRARTNMQEFFKRKIA